MSTRRSIALGLSVAAVALSACAGPKAPFDVGTQAAPVDLVLGEHEAVVEAPVGPLPFDRTNVNGGAIALGHPVGASGARLALTLLHQMSQRSVDAGVASLCIGGGQGGALLFNRN